MKANKKEVDMIHGPLLRQDDRLYDPCDLIRVCCNSYLMQRILLLSGVLLGMSHWQP